MIYGSRVLHCCRILTLHSPDRGDDVSGIDLRIRRRSAASLGLGQLVMTRRRKTPQGCPAAEEGSILSSTAMGLMAAEKNE